MADNAEATLLRRRARRRLVGAVALVILVVVLLPIVLDQQPKSVTQALTVQIPSQDAGPFQTRVLPPLSTPPEASKGGESVRAPQGKSEKSPSISSAESAQSPSKRESAKASEPPKKSEAGRTGSRAKEAYMVPLGAFTNSDNAKQVQDKAASAGFSSYTESVRVAQGEQTRVRAGPFPNREAAEKARDKLKALGLDVGQVAPR